MANEGDNQTPPGGGEGAPPPADPWTPPDRAAFEALQAQATEAAAALAALKASQDAAAEAAAEAARQADLSAAELAETRGAELEAAKARLAEYETAEAARVEAVTAKVTARIAAIPEDARALLPDLSHLSPDAQAAYLDANLEKLVPATRPAGAGPRPTAGRLPIPPECVAEANAQGIDPAVWLKSGFFRKTKPDRATTYAAHLPH